MGAGNQTLTGESFGVTLDDEDNFVSTIKMEIETKTGVRYFAQELMLLKDELSKHTNSDGNGMCCLGWEYGSDMGVDFATTEAILKDDDVICEACTVLMLVKPGSVELEWEWDTTSPLIIDGEFNLSGPCGTIATRVMGPGVSKVLF